MNFNIDPNTINQITSFIPYCIIGLILFVVVFVVLPLVFRFTLGFEAIALIMTALSDYFENRLLVWAACIFGGSMLCGCCVLTMFAIFLIVGSAGNSALGCGTPSASGLCSLFGR